MRIQSMVYKRGFSMKQPRAVIIALFLLLGVQGFMTSSDAAEIRSRSAVAIEASTGRVLYGKNPNLRLAPASTTKLMTAMVVLDRVALSDTIVISERAATVSPIRAHFRAGEKATVETLLYAALIKSANDAACALAEGVGGSEERFTELMNQKAIALGLSDTKFINATGLPGHGQYTTGYDLARMLRHALKYPLIKEIINTKASRISTEDGREIFIKNSNRLLWADESMLGGKTGYTREAKHCFVSASEHANETVITAVMGSPSRETLWKDSEEVMGRGFAVINGNEEPLMYFTKADYKASLQPAAYKVKSSEVKETPQKKKSKKVVKKKKRPSSKAYVKRDKAKGSSGTEEKG